MADRGGAQTALRRPNVAPLLPMTDSLRTIYFHGLPGSAAELGLAGRRVPAHWCALERSDNRSGSTADAHFDEVSRRVRELAGDGPLRLVGFSLGAFAALQVASRITDRVLSLHLVSASAPLQSGDFLPHMAGKAVFTIAQRSPLLFSGLSNVQSVLARASAKTLLAALFGSAQGRDLRLIADPQFKAQMTGIVSEGFGRGLQNYKREISAYVQDWSAILPGIHHEVSLWHGEMDNWTPPEMATTLAGLLPNVSGVKMLPEQSHYSTLLAYLGQSFGQSCN